MSEGSTSGTTFNVIGLIVVVGLVIVGVGLLLPSLNWGQRRHGPQMPNMTQLRGIHQGMVSYAQSNKSGGNDGYYPGLDPKGNVVPDGDKTGHSGDGSQPAAQMWMMLTGNFFTPEYIINPADTARFALVYPAMSKPIPAVTNQNYSYAFLGIGDTDGRKVEWKETLNTSAIVMSDRAIGTGPSDLGSVWTQYYHGSKGQPGWRGGVVHNDNSTSFEMPHTFNQTKYGNSKPNALDDLFEDDPSADDAYLVHQDANTAYSAD